MKVLERKGISFEEVCEKLDLREKNTCLENQIYYLFEKFGKK